MEKLKKICCIILTALVILLSIAEATTTVYAGQYDYINDSEEYEYYNEIGATLGYFGYDSNESIYCSQILDVATEGKIEETAMMVFEGDETIGILTKQVIDDDILYSFVYSDFVELDEIVDEGKEIILINSEDKLVYVSDDNVEILIDSSIENHMETPNNIIEKFEKNQIKGVKVKKEKLPKEVSLEIDEKYDVNNIETQSNSDTSQKKNIVTNHFYVNDRYHSAYYQLNVPYVKNDNNGLEGKDKKGLCWAATGASLSRYFKKTDFDTYDIFAKLKIRYGGIPIGTTGWYSRMFDMLGLRYEEKNRKLSYNEVIESLSKGRPIDMLLSRYENGEFVYGHSIILCGTFVYLGDSKYYYVYVDSNVKGYVVNSIIPSTKDTATGTTFYYTDGTDLYNNWYYSYMVFK